MYLAERPIPANAPAVMILHSASVLIELKKIYGCDYDDFFAGLDGDPD